MKIIYNSFMGGLFRTLGKFIAFIVLFLVFGYIVSSNDLKIADLIGFGKVKAWGTISSDWTDVGISQYQCNSARTSCKVATTNPSLYSPGTELPYTPCTNIQCPNNSYHDDNIGFFRVRMGLSQHSFDSDCMYRLSYNFLLVGYNYASVVANNLDSINNNIVIYGFNINTTNGSSGATSAPFFFNARFEKLSGSGSLRLVITFRPNSDGLKYADMQFGIKDPSFSYSNAQIIPFRGFEKIRYVSDIVQYTRSSTEQDEVNNYYNEQNWNTVNSSINNVENSVNGVNDSIKGIDDYIKDGSIDNNHISSGMHDLPQSTSLTPFADFLNLPLNWIQDFMDTSNSCHNLVIPLPFVNQNLTLPCMSSFWNKLGALASLIDLVWIAVIGSRIFRMFYRLTIDVIDLDPNSFNHLSKLKEWEL